MDAGRSYRKIQEPGSEVITGNVPSLSCPRLSLRVVEASTSGWDRLLVSLAVSPSGHLGQLTLHPLKRPLGPCSPSPWPVWPHHCAQPGGEVLYQAAVWSWAAHRPGLTHRLHREVALSSVTWMNSSSCIDLLWGGPWGK